MTTENLVSPLIAADARWVRKLPRRVTLVALVLTLIAVQFSIATSQILFSLALVSWVTTLVVERRLPSAPPWILPLVLYAAWSLVSAAFAPDLRASLQECKQLVLLLLIPLTYEIVDEGAAMPLTTLVLAAGAASALVGIGQFSILHYDDLGQRPRSTLGLYMTFSGLMMLTLNLAVARVLFGTKARMWPAIVVPALAVVLPLSLARNAWVGAGFSVALLLAMRDWRLTAVVPAAAAAFFVAAPAQILRRFYSIFDLNDLSRRDRFAMARAGFRIIREHPMTGVGPNMIERVYAQYREPDAVLQNPPHLHNVPLQIAAERGLPALALWVWFVVAIVIAAMRLYRQAPREGSLRFLSATALASVVAMLGAGMFEHNFGDSEFQMLFLVLITLPFAVARTDRSRVERP